MICLARGGNDTADGLVGAAICRPKIMYKENGRLVATPTFLNGTPAKFERKTNPGGFLHRGRFIGGNV